MRELEGSRGHRQLCRCICKIKPMSYKHFETHTSSYIATYTEATATLTLTNKHSRCRRNTCGYFLERG